MLDDFGDQQPDKSEAVASESPLSGARLGGIGSRLIPMAAIFGSLTSILLVGMFMTVEPDVRHGGRRIVFGPASAGAAVRTDLPVAWVPFETPSAVEHIEPFELHERPTERDDPAAHLSLIESKAAAAYLAAQRAALRQHIAAAAKADDVSEAVLRQREHQITLLQRQLAALEHSSAQR